VKGAATFDGFCREKVTVRVENMRVGLKWMVEVAAISPASLVEDEGGEEEEEEEWEGVPDFPPAGGVCFFPSAAPWADTGREEEGVWAPPPPPL